MRLTLPQSRALMHLPADGGWAAAFGKMAPAINSLTLYHPNLVDHQWGDFGPRGGRCQRVRLTAAGIAERGRRAVTTEDPA